MYESDIQSGVSEKIIDGQVGSLNLSITDNERCVIVKTDNDEDAAYTAEEARELAQALKCVSDQRWDGNNDDVIEYIRDLAAVVDGDKTTEDVREKWNQRDLDLNL